jgi:peptide/nickel transport system substrate-binding protein
MRTSISIAAGAMAVAGMAATAVADNLTFGSRVETSSIDPHFFNSPPNLQIASHIFDKLVKRDHNEQLQPNLAVSWKPVEKNTWEIKLAKDAKWHDGSPFTADDVLFTAERSPNVQGSTSTPGRYFLQKEFIKVDDHTLHIKTEGPYPTMANDLSVPHIISRKHGKGATTEQYNNGKATIGTGPYKFVKWVSGDEVVLTANPNYWGAKPKWDNVVYKKIVSGPSRVAALLSGDVDLIDFVPPEDVRALEKNKKVVIHRGSSNRIIQLVPDVSRDSTPMVWDNDGKAIWPNPLMDYRVRKAISKAIDRNAIVDRVLEGQGIPAGQTVAPGMHGHAEDLKPEPFDPEGAKKLLAQAGFPDGFRVKLHGPNDRYVNDAKIVTTLAQMLTRVGIKSEVETMPKSVYFTRCRKGLYSLMLLGYGSDTGDASAGLNGLIHSLQPARGLGRINRGLYANRRVDDLADAALFELDQDKRLNLIQDAYRIAMKHVASIPIHWQVNIWASRPGLVYESRKDENTLAMSTSKAM